MSPNKQTMRLQQIQHMKQFVSDNKLNRIEQALDQRTTHLSVVLENIYQAHNISAVIRSCDCFGIQDLHIIENNNRFKVNPSIALGAAQWLSIKRYDQQELNTRQCIKQLKSEGYQIAAMTLKEESINLDELDISQKTALCIGVEETGLSETLHDLADVNVHIPMAGFTQSFNLSVATALALQTLTTKMKQSAINWSLSQHQREEITLNWLTNIAQNGQKILARFNKQNS